MSSDFELFQIVDRALADAAPKTGFRLVCARDVLSAAMDHSKLTTSCRAPKKGLVELEVTIPSAQVLYAIRTHLQGLAARD